MQSENPRPLDNDEPEPDKPVATGPVPGGSPVDSTDPTPGRTPPDAPASLARDGVEPAAGKAEQADAEAPVASVTAESGAADNVLSNGKPAASPEPPVTPPTPFSEFSRPVNSTVKNESPVATPEPVQNSAPSDVPAASQTSDVTPVTPQAPLPYQLHRPSTPASTRPAAASPAPPPPAARPEQAKPAEKPKGLLDLYDSEELVCEVDSGDDGRFVLTNQRLIYQGRSADSSLFSAAAVEDVTAIEFGRRPRDSRSAWWGVVGLLAAIAVWQVTTNETVGAVAGAVVGGISLLLLADYWFRPAGLILKFGTPGGTVQGPVSSKRVRDAEELAARVQQIRRPSSGRSRTGSSGRPPGGSPGIG